MKKALLIALTLATTMVLAQEPGGPSDQAAQPAPQSQKKEIKDQPEYQAYINALQTADVRAKAAALEGFLQQYPNSVVKSDALEALMGTYQQLGDAAKLEATARSLVQADPGNLSGLAILAYFTKAKIESGQAAQQVPQLAQEGLDFAQKGMQALQTATPPEGTPAPAWEQRKAQMGSIFNNVAGFCALQLKNYPDAQRYLGNAVQANPNDITSVYPLALAYLEQQPMNPMGFWYGARAVALAATPEQANAITRYVRSRYIRFHGTADGLEQLLAQAKAAPTPPADFKVTPAPTPAELAAQIAGSKQVKDMSFDEIQLILTSGNQQVADQVWTAIKGQPIALQAKLITGSASKLMVAGSADDVEANKADIELTMVAPIPAKMMPAEGAMVPIQGKPATYDASPFMVHMGEGQLVTPKTTTPAKRPPVATKKGAAKKK